MLNMLAGMPQRGPGTGRGREVLPEAAAAVVVVEGRGKRERREIETFGRNFGKGSERKERSLFRGQQSGRVYVHACVRVCVRRIHPWNFPPSTRACLLISARRAARSIIHPNLFPFLYPGDVILDLVPGNMQMTNKTRFDFSPTPPPPPPPPAFQFGKGWGGCTKE